MKDQLLLLQKLQAIDLEAKEVRKQIEALPAKLAPAKEDLAKLEAILQMERDKIAEAESWKKEQEDMVSREEEALKNAKAKLQEAKNARDFSAASREVDNKKRSIHDREQEVLKVYEALENTRGKLEGHTADVAKLREHIEGEEAKFADELAELENKEQEIIAGRVEVTGKLDASLLKRYETVIKRRGTAVVEVKNGVCQGCNMTLPPQLANVVARFESIESCRQCNRLLYRAEMLEDSDNEDEAAAQEAS